jgi:hypothetical protein
MTSSQLKKLFDKNIDATVREHTNFIVQTYLDAGYEIYLVGGPVRDLLVGLSPKDIDFTSNCPLEKTKEMFDHVIPTGEEHGTLTIHIDGENYEVTRYRTDVDTDGRKATIAYSETFEEDAERRDLTVNAIGFNPITGEIKDPTGGMKDFEDKKIRFVGNALDRIREDELRALRYMRFIVKLDQFGFTPDEEEYKTVVKSYKPGVVSVERIYQEIDGMLKLLKNDDSSKGFLVKSLQDMKIFDRFGSKTKMDKAIAEIFETEDYFPLVNAMDGEHQKLKVGNEYKKLYTVFDNFADKDLSDRVVVKDLLGATKGDFDVVERVLDYYKSYEKGNSHKDGIITFKDLKNKEGTDDAEPFMISHLRINGDDLMQRGLKGRAVGETLNMMLEKVKEDPSFNNKDDLSKMADALLMFFI